VVLVSSFDRCAGKKVEIRKLENGDYVLEIAATKAVILSRQDLQNLLAEIIQKLAR